MLKKDPNIEAKPLSRKRSRPDGDSKSYGTQADFNGDVQSPKRLKPDDYRPDDRSNSEFPCRLLIQSEADGSKHLLPILAVKRIQKLLVQQLPHRPRTPSRAQTLRHQRAHSLICVKPFKKS